jgi:3-hydroxy-3-methylglutaryl CoA synthase
MYLITAFLCIYALCIVLCGPVGYPKAAKAGFALVAAGFVAMWVSKNYTWNIVKELSVASLEEVDDIIRRSRRGLTLMTWAEAVGLVGAAILL